MAYTMRNCRRTSRKRVKGFIQAVARAQFLELANKISGVKNMRRLNYFRELQGLPKWIFGVIRDDMEMDSAKPT